MAVNNLRAWFERGENVNALLPVLQTYLGHSSIGDTAYYLHLTAESYPDITARVKQAFGDIVPSLTGGPLMATDFAVGLRRFLTDHLAGLRGCSPNTISSYKDAFKLLIYYMRDERVIPPERLTLERIDVTAVTGFIAWLQATAATAPRHATSASPRSARSSAGCKPRTQRGWRAARTSSRSPRASTTGRPWRT